MTPGPSAPAPGPSSLADNGDSSVAPGPSAASSSSPHLPRQRSRSTRQDAFASALLPPTSDHNADLKHCAACGQQLEAMAADALPSQAAATRVINVGSHAFEVPLTEPEPQPSTGTFSDVVVPASLTTEDGRPICQACAEAFPALIRPGHHDPGDAMDVDTERTIANQNSASGSSGGLQMQTTAPISSRLGPPHESLTWEAAAATGTRANEDADASSSAISNNTALSISIASGSRNGLASRPRTPFEDEPNASPAEVRRGPSPPRDREIPASGPVIEPTLVGRSRDDSFSRSQRSPLLQHLATGRFTADAEIPVVCVPSTSNSNRDSRARPGRRETSSQVPDSDTDAPRYFPYHAYEDNTAGPSAMTRPRLSTAIDSAQRIAGSITMSRSSSVPCSSSNDVATLVRQREPLWSSKLLWFQPELPDPMADISRIRMPPKGRGCLYPGSIYNGTQKSGRLSYEVTVEILNIDLNNSHLEGYLDIRGLTEDWPELTTFFTAEIIGKDHGFVTGRWGATEADDMKHWNRFGPFKTLHRSLPEDKMRFNHLNKPFVFMRWKERFLVPDWRVRDISGASFAGFYYVCAWLGDPSEWTGGSVEPSSTRFSATASPFVPTTSTSANTTAERTTTGEGTGSPRVRTPVSRRRLGSQNTPLGGASNEAEGAPTTSRRISTAIQDVVRAQSAAQSAALARSDSRTALENVVRAQSAAQSAALARSDSRTALENELLEREVFWRSRGLGLGTGGEPGLTSQQQTATAAAAATVAASPTRAQSGARSRSQPGRGNITVDVLMADASDAPARSAATAGNTTTEGDVTPSRGPQARGGAAEEAAASTSGSASTAMDSGRISAFYYHENSEPYQQLDLRHVEKRSSEAFEMR